MPFLSEAASAIKSRFGFHDHSESTSLVQSTPDLLKSAAKDSVVRSSAFRSIGYWEDDGNSAAAPNSAAVSSAQSFEIREDPSFWKDHNVQVIIRMRPLSNTEISLQGYGKCVRQESCQTISWTGHPESRFTFDLVADENVSQEKLFKVAGLPMVENCMGGYNSCMFAYGQTGSGKTHTMLGDIEGGTRRHSVNCGMTPRIFEHLFSRIQKEKEIRRDEKLKFTCKCSFLEIYNEQILDLLDPSSNNLQIREDSKKGVYVENLKEIEVTNARDVIQQLIQGAANRKVAATNMNHASSRSHSVFTCIIESQWESQGVTHFRFARLNLVDLAGSERQKSSGAEGERLKEATNINKSLSTLGLVIMNLVSISNGKSLHVPYRDSKLTFLLQDSLGGNSKTIIIANISPSICCSLETLSTLKFAQRAKFIKNNAIVNEDASGDVIAMRIQIQQLKKEVSRLRGLVGGGETQNVDTSVVSFPGSPGSFKWEGTQGSFSPLTSAKRIPHKKDYDIALVGAFRREKDKDMALQALRDENQAAMKLAKQREVEIKGLKMRLRFREAGIKRLEAVASGKISAEIHLLNEKEELLKEIELLRAQVDRNQEVTRFAMENLQLKEEIRRLKSFYEEGEREMMNEQIMELKNKLLEALDWKFMHATNSKTNSDSVMEDALGDDNLISQQEPSPKSRWQSSLREENEFLRIQAIQNQAEMDTLRKQLEVCLQEKEQLERHVDDLTAKFEQEKSQTDKEGREQMDIPSTSDMPVVNISDQQELKAMVDAIAAASQREAEAHETAIVLSKENEELRLKLKALIEDNSKLIELYEQAAAENSGKNVEKGENGQETSSMVDDSCQILQTAREEETELKSVVENLQHQLSEMNEENENLMTLYERAMQERDDLKRTLACSGHGRIEPKGEMDSPEKLVAETVSHEAQEGGESEYADKPTISGPGLCPENDGLEEEELLKVENEVDIQANSDMDIDVSNSTAANLSEELNCAREKLEKVDEQISDVSDAVRNLSSFNCAEKAMVEVDKLSTEIEVIEHDIHVKRQHFESLKLLLSEVQERRTLTDKKLSALKYSLSNFSSSMSYFEQREARARAGVSDLTSHLNRKKEALAALQASKEGLVNARKKNQECEAELMTNIASLKSKLEEENRMREGEKVLFPIDNTHNTDSSLKNWHFSGKATELLKLEEEKPKLQSEMNLSQEKLGVIRKELGNLNKKVTNVEGQIQAVELEIQHGLKISEEKELAFQRVKKEKEMLLEFRDSGVSEIGHMIIDLHQCVFENDLKESEIKMLEEELQVDFARAQELQSARVIAANNKNSIISSMSHSSMLRRIEEGMENLRAFIVEIKLLLEGISHAT